MELIVFIGIFALAIVFTGLCGLIVNIIEDDAPECTLITAWILSDLLVAGFATKMALQYL